MALYRGIGGAGDSTTDATVTDVTAQAVAAASSATAAAGSANSAGISATAASNSATTATTKASEASTSASNAATALTNTQAVLANAETVYDNFDDRYLGDKTSNPTLDNDGNALLTGALYFNTTDGVMKVYDGSAWLAAYASLSGALIATNNLSDLENATNARTNLGLGTAATTASTDYATAAQGALADSALQSVSESDVTQHETALTITESQISDLGTYETADADILKADTADTITAPMAGQITDNVASLSFDMSASNNFETTPSATGALTFTGFTKGQSGNIYLDNSAGVTITAASTTYINATDLTTISSAGKYFLSYYCVDATGSAEIVLVSITQVLTGAGA